MTIKILFSANEENWKRYKAPLQDALDDKSLDYELGITIIPSEVDYIIYAPTSSLQDFSPYTKLKAVLNLWAGVEGVTNNKTLNVPLARMVDSGLTDGMVEWVTGHTLRHHLGIDKHIHGQDGIWRSYVPPLAKDRIITILGLGTLGTACGIALKRLGFKNDIKNRIDETSKYIRPNEGTVDYAYMFIPADGLYQDLLNSRVGSLKIRSKELVSYAYQKKVMIVSPMSLFPMLQITMKALNNLKFEKSIELVIKNVQNLSDHLITYQTYHNKLGNTLNTVVNHYNRTSDEFKKIDKDVMKISEGKFVTINNTIFIFMLNRCIKIKTIFKTCRY